ncbi:MAG: DUF998 domain-containing protein [Thermoplasmata archaeon]
MRDLSARFGALCGIVAIAAFCLLYFVAMSLDSEYTFGENYLSDLGVREGAWAFNSGLVIAGVLLVVFTLFGLAPLVGRQKRNLPPLVMMTMGGALLVSIGIFTEDNGGIHTIVSVWFFLTMWVAIILFTEAFYRTRALGRVGWIVSASAALVGVLLVALGGTPLAETIAVMAILAWGLVVSVAMYAKLPVRSVQ